MRFEEPQQSPMLNDSLLTLTLFKNICLLICTRDNNCSVAP